MAEPEQEVKPVLSIDPPYLEFGTGSHSLFKLGKPDLTLTITNTGSGTLTGRIKPQVSWLTIDPNEFSCEAGENSIHGIHINQDARRYWDVQGRFLNNLFLVISNAGSIKINGSYKPVPGSPKRAFFSWIMIASGILIIVAFIIIGFFTFGINGSSHPAQPNINLLFTQGAATEIARMTLNPPPTSTPQPTAIPLTPTQANKTPSPTLTFTPWPRDHFDNPEVFINNYYQMLNEGKYDKAWDMLSDGFKDSCCNIAGNDSFEIYKTWWQPIKKVTVNSAKLQAWDTNPAPVYVSITYQYKDGKSEDALMSFDIIANETKNSLLIDVAKPLQ
jgi:hypothetical protein